MAGEIVIKINSFTFVLFDETLEISGLGADISIAHPAYEIQRSDIDNALFFINYGICKFENLYRVKYILSKISPNAVDKLNKLVETINLDWEDEILYDPLKNINDIHNFEQKKLAIGILLAENKLENIVSLVEKDLYVTLENYDLFPIKERFHELTNGIFKDLENDYFLVNNILDWLLQKPIEIIEINIMRKNHSNYYRIRDKIIKRMQPNEIRCYQDGIRIGNIFIHSPCPYPREYILFDGGEVSVNLYDLPEAWNSSYIQLTEDFLEKQNEIWLSPSVFLEKLPQMKIRRRNNFYFKSISEVDTFIILDSVSVINIPSPYFCDKYGLKEIREKMLADICERLVIPRKIPTITCLNIPSNTDGFTPIRYRGQFVHESFLPFTGQKMKIKLCPKINVYGTTATFELTIVDGVVFD